MKIRLISIVNFENIAKAFKGCVVTHFVAQEHVTNKCAIEAESTSRSSHDPGGGSVTLCTVNLNKHSWDRLTHLFDREE